MRKTYEVSRGFSAKVLNFLLCIILGKQKMATDDHSYIEMFSSYRSHSNLDEVISATINKLSSELNFDSVKSCLTVGPFDGQHEVYFIKQCVPNISKLIGVEPNHESAERLRARLEKSLPGVDSQVIETTIQSWKGLDDPVDLVLMIHVLYYLNQSERKELYKKLREQWLSPGGRVVVLSVSSGHSPASYHEASSRLGTSMLSWKELEPDILEAGFVKQHAQEMQYMRDFSNLDEPYLRFCQHFVNGPLGQPVTLDDVRKTLKAVFPEAKLYSMFEMFVILQKA